MSGDKPHPMLPTDPPPIFQPAPAPREQRFTRRWFYPGVRLKRWIILLLASAAVLGVGFAGMLGKIFSNLDLHLINVRPIAHQIQSLRFIDFLLLAVGLIGIVLAVRRGVYALVTLWVPPRAEDLSHAPLKRLRLKRGPRIVVVGGGTGLPMLLSGLKGYTANLSAIVTMADDGGSSGRLRREYQTLPPGDLRNCLIALAETGPLMSRLFLHRFKGEGGGIEGHSFGNLFITALAEITGDFATGVKAASEVLAVSGKVLPVTLEPVTLEAELVDGRVVRGESAIGQSRTPIRRVRLVPPDPKPAPDTCEAIAEADAIVYGPGSLYTSVLPNLLVPGILDAIAASRAVKIYVGNLMTQPGETDGLSLSDHVRALREATRPDLIQYVLANAEPPTPDTRRRYAELGAQPVLVEEADVAQLDNWDITLIRTRLAAAGDLFRHDPVRLAKVILKLIII